MLEFSFALNDKPLSELKSASRSFPAFSGFAPYINKKIHACMPDLGPIPPGDYWIVGRPTGGRMGWLSDWVQGKSDWFALFADDGKIDDSVKCKEIERGNFRLHPASGTGISKGCITIKNMADFTFLRSQLLAAEMKPVKDTGLMAYGKVKVA